MFEFLAIRVVVDPKTKLSTKRESESGIEEED